jgi:hypothetical protein
VLAQPGFVHHPLTRLLVQICQISEGTQRQEIDLHVLDSGFHDPLLRRVSRRAIFNLEVKCLGALAVAALDDWVEATCLGDRALGVIYDEPAGNASEPGKGSFMTPEPRRDRLIHHELHVLMARKTQRHDKGPGTTLLAGQRIEQERSGAEIHLRRLGRGIDQMHRRIRRAAAPDGLQHPVHRGVAAGIAVSALQGGVDHHPANPLTRPLLHQRPVGFDARDRRAGALGILPSGLQRLCKDRFLG